MEWGGGCVPESHRDRPWKHGSSAGNISGLPYTIDGLRSVFCPRAVSAVLARPWRVSLHENSLCKGVGVGVVDMTVVVPPQGVQLLEYDLFVLVAFCGHKSVLLLRHLRKRLEGWSEENIT